MNQDFNSQIWQEYNKQTQSSQSFMNCIDICSNTANQVVYLLGPFDKNFQIRRKLEIFVAHSKLKFDLTLMQIDRWNVGENFNIFIDGQLVSTWTFTGPSSTDYCGMSGNQPVNMDTQVSLSFEVAHIINLVEIVIDTSIIGSGQWGLVNFQMNALNCIGSSCSPISPLTFDLSAAQVLSVPISQQFQVYVNFNTPMTFLQGNFNSNVNNSIFQIDTSGYTVSVNQVNSTQFVLYLDLATTIRDNYMNISFITPENVRAVSTNNTLVTSYNNSVLLPTYFYYSPSTITASDDIAFVVWVLGIILTLSLLPLILLRQFEVVAYTYYVHQMIFYYSFSQIRNPYNIVVFFKSFKVYNFDFLPNIFNLAINSNIEYGYVSQFEKQSLFLANAGYLYTLFLVFLVIYLICKFSANKKFMKIQRVQKIMANIVKNIFEWNLFLEYILLSFMHLLFAIFLQFFSLDFSYPVCYFSFFLCMMTIIFMVLQFYYLFTKVIGRKELIIKGDPSIERQYGVLWHSLKKDSFYFQTCFNLILIFRRLLFIFITTFLYDFVYVQYNIFNVCNCCVIFLVAYQRPYKEGKNNFKVFVSEIQLIIIQAMIQNFGKDEGNDEQSRVNLGWFMISQILILIIMHYAFVGYEIIRYARLWFVKQITEAEEEFKKKIEKAADEQTKLLNKKDNFNNVQTNLNLDQPNSIAVSVLIDPVDDKSLHSRRRRKSSNFVEIISQSNKHIEDEPDKANQSLSQNDVLTIKSNFQESIIRKDNRQPSIVVFSKNVQGEEHVLQPILKKPTYIKTNTITNEVSFNQIENLEHIQPHPQPVIPTVLNDSKEEDAIQPRAKGHTVSIDQNIKNDDDRLRHRRRKRNNTYISQVSMVSMKSATSIPAIDDLPNANTNNENNNTPQKPKKENGYANLKQSYQRITFHAQTQQEIPTSSTQIPPNPIRKRHRNNSKVFEEAGIPEQLSSRTISINPAQNKAPKTEKTDDSESKDQSKVRRKKTKGVRVDSTQFQNIFEQIKDNI